MQFFLENILFQKYLFFTSFKLIFLNFISKKDEVNLKFTFLSKYFFEKKKVKNCPEFFSCMKEVIRTVVHESLDHFPVSLWELYIIRTFKSCVFSHSKRVFLTCLG